MFATDIRNIIEQIEYREGYWIECGDMTPCRALSERWQTAGEGPVAWIEITHQRPDADTGEPGLGWGGKRYIHSNATKSDVIRMIFGALMAYEEHEVREFFRFDGRRLFDPHANLG